MSTTKEDARSRRKMSIRRRMQGQTTRPRLSVFRSAKHIYAQVIDDARGTTLATASTVEPALRDEVTKMKKSERAKRVGLEVAKRCLQLGIKQVVFDRNGFIYHGRVMALAQAAREGGLEF